MGLRVVAFLALVAGAPGCAFRFQQAMIAADDAVQEQRWYDAVGHYDRAFQSRPTAAKAQTGLLAASEMAGRLALEDARAALDRGDYDAVVERVGYIRGLSAIDVPEAQDLWNAAAAARAAKVDAAWEFGPRRAYQEAVAFEAMFPKSAPLGPMFDRLRRYWVTTAEEARVAGQYAEAVAAIRTIAEFEPAQQPLLVDPMERHIASSWAESLSVAARAEEKAGKLGSACLRYAHAWELAGRGSDHADAMRLAGEVRARGRFTVAVQAKGSSARARELTKKLESAVSTLGATAPVGKADLTIHVDVPAASCSEKVQSQEKELEYVAGKARVPNPAHQRVSAAYERVDAAWNDLQDEALSLRGRMEVLQSQVGNLDAALYEAKRAYTTAKLQEDEAHKQVDAASKIRSEQAVHVDAVRAEHVPTATVLAKAGDLERTVTILVEWQEVLKTAERDRRAAERSSFDLEAARQPLFEELTSTTATYDEVLAQRDEHEAFRQKLSIQKQMLPPTLEREVTDALGYVEKTWTRTCTTNTFVSMSPKWKTEVAKNKRITKTALTTDTSHGESDVAGLEADLKAYGDSDQALISKAERDTAAAVLAWLVDLEDEHFRLASRDAFAQLETDPTAATTFLLGLYLEAPENFDVDQLARVQRHLVGYGVKDLRGALSGTPAAAPESVTPVVADAVASGAP